MSVFTLVLQAELGPRRRSQEAQVITCRDTNGITSLGRGDTVDQEQEQEVQRVTLRAGSLLEPETAGGAASGSGWRISPIPWRMLLPPDPDQVLCSSHIRWTMLS